MKKTLLLSVVASTMIMAGGDIAPVEPVVEAPVEVSAWDFNGQLVAYTQTVDASGDASLFDNDTTYAAWGAQLGATNSDIFAGIGAGVEVAGIVASTGNLAGFYGNGGNAGTTSGGITQGYLTYGFDSVNTSIKLGRQTLPKSLSPFAFSEGWQMFKNTFDAALVVNTSLPDTTLVYAFVKNGNSSVGAYLNEDSFTAINGEDGAHMLTAQNKSFDGVTLTGTYYTLPDAADIIWGDATAKFSGITLGVQGGQIDPDVGDAGTAYGLKVAGEIAMFNLFAAYSSVSDDGVDFINTTGIKSPLYTQMVLNNVGNYHSASGSDFLKVGGTAKALGGTFKAFYGMGDNDSVALKGDYSQLDLMYVTKITENTKLFAAYVYTDDDGVAGPSENNFVRFWARYSFN